MAAERVGVGCSSGLPWRGLAGGTTACRRLGQDRLEQRQPGVIVVLLVERGRFLGQEHSYRLKDKLKAGLVRPAETMETT